MRKLLLREKPTILLEEETDIQVVVVVEEVVVPVAPVEEAVVKEAAVVVVKGVAVHQGARQGHQVPPQEGLHQEGKGLTRVPQLAVVQLD